MKKIVIAGSASLQNEIETLKNQLTNYQILDYPKPLSKEKFDEVYPNVFRSFFENITVADVFLLFNADKKGISGYIGSESFAELVFALSQNNLYGKKIEIFIYKMPEKSVHCYDEISLWLKYGWIKLWNE